MDSVPLRSSSKLWDLDFKLNAKLPFIWKEDFGPLNNSSVLFLLSPGKMLLTMFLFQKWLGSPFPEDVWARWLLMHWLQLQFNPCEALPSFESALLAVVDKVHRSSTWVKVQIRIIKYYSSKSKSTAFSILLEWKYKSTQFFMYLSKKVLIDRFILQFYIDYFI